MRRVPINDYNLLKYFQWSFPDAEAGELILKHLKYGSWAPPNTGARQSVTWNAGEVVSEFIWFFLLFPPLLFEWVINCLRNYDY